MVGVVEGAGVEVGELLGCGRAERLESEQSFLGGLLL